MNRRNDEADWFTFFDIAGGHGGGRFKLLDVRSRAEWRANHIVESTNVPLAELDSVRSAFPRPASFRDEIARAAGDLRRWGYELEPPGGYGELVKRGDLATER